jgi:hypothetical protein
MAVFQIEDTNVNAPRMNNNDKIMLFLLGRYISSNEAVNRIFDFSIHGQDSAVTHLAVHLENAQRIFFANETAFDLC